VIEERSFIMFRWNSLLFTPVAFFMPLCISCWGTEVLVPQEYISIQSAVDAAADGDTVIVAPGRYVENVVIDGKNVTLCSIDPSDPAVVAATIIDGNQTGPCVSFLTLSGGSVAGFTLVSGDPAVECLLPKSVSKISSNVIKGCGKAIRFSGGSAPDIIGNRIEGNTWGIGLKGYRNSVVISGNVIVGNGSGISTRPSGDPAITTSICDNVILCSGDAVRVGAGCCVVSGNIIEDCRGGIDVNYFEPCAIVTDNTLSRCCGIWGGTLVSGNTVCDGLAGIYDCSTAVGNTVVGNTGGRTAGIESYLVQDNVIMFNWGDKGGGVRGRTVTGNTIIGNEAAKGGGIYCDWGGLISNNIIRSNTASGVGGGVWLESASSLTAEIIIGNVIVGNVAGAKGGGVWLYEGTGHGSIVASNTIIGNRASETGALFLYAADHCCYGDAIVDSTIRMNSSMSGEQVVCWDRRGLTVKHCLIEGGQAAIGGWGGDCIWGPGNIDADPLFVDPGCWDDAGTPFVLDDDVFVPGDYHLLAGSPCIDAGTNDIDYSWTPAVETLPDLDLAGVQRVIDGDFSGTATVDIGAYEFLPGDADGDGRVNLLDLLRIRNSLGLDPSSSPEARLADVNGDGAVNMVDLLLTRRQFQSR